MPLSKNLYDIEDLCAFFLFSLEHHDIPSAYAVIKELQESLEHNKLESLLVFAWLLTEPSKDFTPQRWSALTNKRYDVFVSTFQSNESPVFVATDVVVCESNISDSLLEVVRKSLKKQQVWRAYLQSLAVCKDGGAMMSFLHILGLRQESSTLLESFGSYLLPRILHHCLYVLASADCMSTPLMPPLGSFVEINMSTKAILKWGLTPKSTDRFIGAPLFIYDTSPYWTEQREVYGILPNKDHTIVFQSDDLCDQFYAKNFPNDIPDEWSEDERIKRVGSPIKITPNSVSKLWQQSLSRIICPRSHFIM